MELHQNLKDEVTQFNRNMQPSRTLQFRLDSLLSGLPWSRQILIMEILQRPSLLANQVFSLFLLRNYGY